MLRPYRHLAVRVLARAFRDLAGPAAERESARAFLSGAGLLRYWCELAAVDPGWIARRARAVQGPALLPRRYLVKMGDPDVERARQSIDE